MAAVRETGRGGLMALRERAVALARAAEESGGEAAGRTAMRLRDSVIRPLGQALGASAENGSPDGPGARPGPGAGTGIGEQLWELAREATTLLPAQAELLELAEAAAALQDLAVIDGDAQSGARLSELQSLVGNLPPLIRGMADGPYLVRNVSRLSDWLGRPMPTRPQMALCRCGQSAAKPFCDGTHAKVGFTDTKDPSRVPDRRDTYVGQQATVFDNRGTCQHSGLCSDRLGTVFRAAQDPFVAPSGGRMDEIIRAVRDCPSGALSYGIDGVEARAEVDFHGRRDPAIEVSKDGPYRITGAIELVDHVGSVTDGNEGASLEHFALCRCGHSQNKPFCSGMHRSVEFRDPVPDPDRTPTMFEWAGGLPALARMTRRFYEKHVPQDPLLAPLFANMSADHPERVAKWLGEVLGGPKAYSEEYGGYPRMLSQHVGKQLTEDQRGRWVTLLLRSAQEAGLPNDAEFRSAFQAYIEWGSRLAVQNSQIQARPPEHMPMPRWDWNTAAGPPGSRISALAAPEDRSAEDRPAEDRPAEDRSAEDRPAEDRPAEVVLPGAGEPVSFAQHIKPLFRSRDRRSMEFAFDLWDHGGVCTHAEAILGRLREGTMPCDGAWSGEQVDLFARWRSDGMDP